MSVLNDVENSLRNLGFKQLLFAIGHDAAQPFDRNTHLTNGAFYSGFCLCCSLIETCGHYLTGLSGNGTSQRCFKAFAQYLVSIDSRYDSTILYKALRCGLLHNFTPSADSGTGSRDFYELVHNEDVKHLTLRPSPIHSAPYSSVTTPATGTSVALGSTVNFATNGTYLNLQSLVADLHTAMNRFFSDAHSNRAIEAKVETCARQNGYPNVR